ncbi:hypothetical protein ACOSQ3_022703 [Xanthoceras sorbifolium]
MTQAYQPLAGQYPVHSYTDNGVYPNAFVAAPSTVMDPAWYVDSGATNHITYDLGNMSIKSDYKGLDCLTVGNGAQIPIAHVGASVINSHTHPQVPLLLNNILHVPSITKNLLSISQFTNDNHVIVEFDSNFCCVKDKNTM